jgi:hypothetical protein
MSEGTPPCLTANLKYTREQIEPAERIIAQEIKSRPWEQTIMAEEIPHPSTANANGSSEAIHARCSSERVMGILEVLSKSCINASGCKIVIPAFSIAVDHDDKVGKYYTIELVGNQ